MKEIVLAGGCFWGVEAFMSKINGVIETEVGYANGTTQNPSYEQVKTSKTGHAEVCYIRYDENKICLEALLNVFWKIIDPTIKNQQGEDKGSQYRTGIYYIDNNDIAVIEKSKKTLQNLYDNPVVTEIEPLICYYKAEEYHQKYLDKNPNGYCHIDLNMAVD